MAFNIIRQDITNLKVDAIVNAANVDLQRGGGVCGAIFSKAGIDELQQACDLLSPINTGEAVITSAFNLPSKFIIHTAGPINRNVGRTNQELTKNKIYHVDLSYDCDEAFLLVNDSGKQKEYNAKSFIVQIPTFVKITDITNPFIKENLNDLELNKTYKVLRMQGSYYVLENNCLCMPYRTEALGFRKMPKTKHPKKTIKELLEWLCEFMEFNRSSEIKDYISNDCVYQSSWGINELSEKACVVAFIRFVHNECMRNGVFYEFKVEEFSKQEVNNLENLDGEPCVKIYYRKQLQAVLFLTLNCRGCISKISIYKNDTLDKSYSVEATQNVDSVICY